jgi:hypothetical protein
MAKFPLSSVWTAPTFNQPWQYNIGGSGGWIFGANTKWAVQQAEGFGLPQMRTGDAPRPWDQGEFAGLDLMPGRDLQFTLFTQQATSVALQTALGQLWQALRPPLNGMDEQPLYFWRPTAPHATAPASPQGTPTTPTYFHSCMVRPRNFGLTSDVAFAYYHQAKPVVQLHATGALFYGPSQSFFWVSPSTNPTANNGNMPMHPYFAFNGPMSGTFSVQNNSLPGSPIIEFSGTPGLASASDFLVVDTDLDVPSALFHPAGGGPAQSWLTYLTARSSPFLIQPAPVVTSGINNLQFIGSGGNLTVQWADAWAMAL